MSGEITVNFYTNTSDKRCVSKNLTSIASKSCRLKGDCDIVHPVLIVTGDAGDYSACNYMDIADFGRSYFATVRSLPGGLLEISGECDVLSSAWDAIKTQPAVIDRNEKEYNLYLADGTFQAYANSRVITKNFSGGFSTPSYVLVTSG